MPSNSSAAGPIAFLLLGLCFALINVCAARWLRSSKQQQGAGGAAGGNMVSLADMSKCSYGGHGVCDDDDEDDLMEELEMAEDGAFDDEQELVTASAAYGAASTFM
jgi:hypothetical protein